MAQKSRYSLRVFGILDSVMQRRKTKFVMQVQIGARICKKGNDWRVSPFYCCLGPGRASGMAGEAAQVNPCLNLLEHAPLDCVMQWRFALVVYCMNIGACVKQGCNDIRRANPSRAMERSVSQRVQVFEDSTSLKALHDLFLLTRLQARPIRQVDCGCGLATLVCVRVSTAEQDHAQAQAGEREQARFRRQSRLSLPVQAA